MNENSTELFICACNNSEHNIIVHYNEEIDEKYFDGSIYVHYHLESRGFWERLKNAWNHIRGKKSIYGDYGELIIEPSNKNTKAIRKILFSLEGAQKELEKREREKNK